MQVSPVGRGGRTDLPSRYRAVYDWRPAKRLTENFKAIGLLSVGHPLMTTWADEAYIRPPAGWPFLTLDDS